MELQSGDSILEGRYRIIERIYQRPRLNLYLGRKVDLQREAELEQWERQDVMERQRLEREPLVAIRELILTGLMPQTRSQIEAAAFEEFVSPVVLGSPRLPTLGDRIHSEGERHYLIMQLCDGRSRPSEKPVILEELLRNQPQWPSWLTQQTVWDWGAQLCRIVARLHRLGVVLGDLDPASILVDLEGRASWAPILLTTWPPPPQFWTSIASDSGSSEEIYRCAFPIVQKATSSAFVAPELSKGLCSEQSDIYSLGAILYLLLTRYAPVAAEHRLSAIEREDGLELIQPRVLNSQISTGLEGIILRALDLDPERRYHSAFELVEALEESEQEEARRFKAPPKGRIEPGQFFKRVMGN